MSHRQRGTPCRCFQGRGNQTDHPIPLGTQANNDGFDLEIPEAVRLMANEWEGKLTGALSAVGRTLERQHN